MNRIIPVFLFALLFGANPCMAQGWENSTKEEALSALKKTNTTMLKAKTLEVEMVQTIIDVKSREVLAESNGFYKRKDSVYVHSKILGIESVQNKEYKVMVDSSTQTIMVDNSMSGRPSIDLANIELFFGLYPIEQIRKRSLANGNTEFDIQFKQSIGYPVKSLSFSYSSSWLIAEFSLLMNPGNELNQSNSESLLSIRYFNYRINQKLKNDEFSAGSIVTFNHGEPKPQKAYAAYQFVNTYRK